MTTTRRTRRAMTAEAEFAAMGGRTTCEAHPAVAGARIAIPMGRGIPPFRGVFCPTCIERMRAEGHTVKVAK